MIKAIIKVVSTNICLCNKRNITTSIITPTIESNQIPPPPPPQLLPQSPPTNNYTLEEFLRLCDEINIQNIQSFSFDGKQFYAKPVKIISGDTFYAVFEYKNKLVKWKFKMMGYNLPQISTNEQDDNVITTQLKMNNVLAKHILTELLTKHIDGVVRIECYKFDNKGRIIAQVYNMVDEESINQMMINMGFGIADKLLHLKKHYKISDYYPF